MGEAGIGGFILENALESLPDRLTYFELERSNYGVHRQSFVDDYSFEVQLINEKIHLLLIVGLSYPRDRESRFYRPRGPLWFTGGNIGTIGYLRL